MSELLQDHDFWLFAGSALMAVCLFVGRRLAKGTQPRQIGDEVE